MQEEKSIYADVLESAISWRVRDMYNLYGTIRRVLFEGRKAERAAMLSELIKMQGGNIGGSAKVETPDDRLKLARELENINMIQYSVFKLSRQCAGYGAGSLCVRCGPAEVSGAGQMIHSASLYSTEFWAMNAYSAREVPERAFRTGLFRVASSLHW